MVIRGGYNSRARGFGFAMIDEDPRDDDADLEQSDAATAIKKEPAPTKREPRQLPPYKLLLHNDDVNTFDHIIRSVRRLTPISEEAAVVKTIEAHETGVALLLVTHRERGELYVEQFASLSVTTSLEPDAA